LRSRPAFGLAGITQACRKPGITFSTTEALRVFRSVLRSGSGRGVGLQAGTLGWAVWRTILGRQSLAFQRPQRVAGASTETGTASAVGRTVARGARG
jgi:hypothetical protein